MVSFLTTTECPFRVQLRPRGVSQLGPFFPQTRKWRLFLIESRLPSRVQCQGALI
jgi:hypothetical protein